MKPAVEPHLSGGRIVMLNQRLGIVDQHFGRNPAKAQKGALHALKPVGLALPQRGADMQPARVAQGGHKQMHPHPLAANPHPRLAKVDLHLLARRRLKPDCRPHLRLQLPAPALHPQLDRAQPDDDPMLARQLLPDHVGIATMPEEALPQPLVQAVERRPAHGLAERHSPALAQIPPHCVACAAELLRQPLGPPAKLMQPQHRGYLLSLKHLLSPHRPRQCRIS
jgi:hypothetical protein